MARKKNVPEVASINRTNDPWRARDALSTLTRAEEIRKDSGLMREVKAEAKRQQKALHSVTGGGRKRAR